MQCDQYREALSARLDGEPLGMPEPELDAHLDACGRCATWADAAAAVTRRVRLAPAPPVPDLTATVLAARPAPRVAVRVWTLGTLLRLALVAVGLGQVLLAWPSLAFGSGAMHAPLHMAHESGAWNLGVAAAFLAVALAPRLAPGALPFLGTFAALLTAVTADDLLAGRVPPDRALGHLLLLAGVVLVAATAWRGRTRRPRAVARGRVTA